MIFSIHRTQDAGSVRLSTVAATATRTPHRRDRRRQPAVRRRAFAVSCALLLAGGSVPPAAEAVVLTFKAAATPSTNPDLGLNTNYTNNTLPDGTVDVRLSSNNTALTLTSTNTLAVQSLNMAGTTSAYTIQNIKANSGGSPVNQTITLGNPNGQANVFAPTVTNGTASDLIYLNSTAMLSILGANSGTNGGTGTLGLTLAASGSFNTIASSILTISANISGAAYTINKTGGGTLNLSGTNSLGAFTMTAGTANLSGTTTLTGASPNFTMSGGTLNLSGTNTATAFTMTGGTLNLSGNNTFSTFATTGTSGTVTLGSNGALGGLTTLTIGVNSTVGLSATVLNAGTTSLTDVIGDTATVSFNGAAGAANGGTLNLAGATETIGSISSSNPNVSLVIGDYTNTGTSAVTSGGLTVGNSASTAFVGIISGTHTSTTAVPAALTKTGSGTLTLSGANTFTGGVAINGGILVANAAETAGTSGPLGASGTISFGGGTLQYGAGNATVVNGTSTGFDYSSRFSNAANQAYNIDTNGNQVTFNANLTSQGGSLTKLGANTLILNGQNTFTGAVNINAGAIRALSAETPGVSGPLGVGGTISFNGGSLQYSVNNSTDYSGRFSNAANQAYTVNTNSQDVTWASALNSQGGSLTKLGAGTLTLDGASTYTGSTTISAGTVRVTGAETPGVSGPLGVGGTINLTGGILQFSATNTTDYSGRFSTAANQFYNINTGAANVIFAGNLTSQGGSLTKTGTGTLTLSAANTYTGGTTVTTGTLQITNGSGTSATGSGAVTVGTGGTLQGRGFIDAGANLITINGTLSPGSNANPVGAIRLSSTAASGALTLANTSTLLFDITDASTKDVVVLNGSTLALNGGTLTLSLGGAFDYNSTYALFTGVGGLTTATDGPFSVINGYDSVNYAPVFTLNGTEYDLTFSAISNVPEPSTWAACAALLAGMVGWRGCGRVRAWLARGARQAA